MEMTLAQLEAITVSYGERCVLSGSLTIHSGEHWLIMGPNGSGKSTLMDVLAGRRWPQRGSVELLGHHLGSVDLRELRRSIALAGTNGFELLHPVTTVHEAVAGGLRDMYAPWWVTPEELEHPRVLECLAQFGLSSLASARVSSLSDGERTKVELARSLLKKCELLLLDEPTRALDLTAREHVLEALSTAIREGNIPATVLVSHQFEDVPAGMTHAAFIKNGVIHRHGLIDDVVTSEYVSDVFELPLEVHSHSGRWSAVRAGT